ncbi:sensor histidine kinase [Sphingomonas sp. DC2300-3]|uniref:sensor histidine kinase n=1 Tax=unclassified Sphingomonas TaxID=196159 RepID=UPI003CF07AE0
MTIEADIDSLALDAERAIAVGLLVTELATNAIKYAYPGRDGIVMIELRNDREEFRLSVSDQGKGLPQPFDLKNSGRHNLGMRMIDSLTRQLQGRIDISSSGGTKFTITAPQ